MSDSVRPHRRQPTKAPCPWDSPGKNTGVGCRFYLQCMKVKSESEVAQSSLTLATPWTAAYQAPPSIFQARVLEWGAIAFSHLCPTVLVSQAGWGLRIDLEKQHRRGHRWSCKAQLGWGGKLRWDRFKRECWEKIKRAIVGNSFKELSYKEK